MHTLILQTPKGMCSDHINGDGLDNRRCNLRICTYAENAHNRNKYVRQKASIYKGVCWHNTMRKWMPSITICGKRIYLGFFESEVEAAKSYNEAAKKYYGEFAKLNEVD